MHNTSKFNSKTILIVMLFLVSLAIAGLAIYVYGHEASAKPKSTQTISSATLPQMVDSLVGNLKKSYPYLQTTALNNQITAGYPVPGYAFQVILPTNTANISLADSRSSNESVVFSYLNSALPILENDMRGYGFGKITGDTQDNSGLSEVNFYKSATAVCQVTVYSQMVITCSPLNTLENIASAANPLFSSYIDAAPASGTNSVNMPNISGSKSAGYTIASMNIFNNYGETKANYYQQNNGSWQLVNLKWYNDPHEDANIMPNCEDFESVQTIREAFTGQACYDSVAKKVSVVQ
jgi:hypothetical protein